MNHTREWMLTILFILGTSQMCFAEMPMCRNRTIIEVSKRVGCAVGDTNCWLMKGGFCIDYIQNMMGQSGKELSLARRIKPVEVRKGDVAKFSSRAHYAYVENVVRDQSGMPIAIDVSEYNYGACWVDRDTMVTDNYKKVSKRSGIPLGLVDGGFLRPE